MQDTIQDKQQGISASSSSTHAKPKLGFLGVGWIGRNRMEMIAKHQAGEVAYISDTAPHNAEEALKSAPKAKQVPSLEAMLHEPEVEGVVIATPSAFHAEQSELALEAGKSVFCQKPLGRNVEETKRVVEVARKNNKLLGVDLSYRHTAAMQEVYKVVQSGELGHIYAVELVFHNAYGPDKAWFYEPKLSGGGCVIDLGVHLVDLALWSLNFPKVKQVQSQLFSKGKPIGMAEGKVEDYASASMELAGNTHMQLSCSWNLPAGQEAIISATFYGTEGGVAMKNVNGSFYDFVAERYYGTKTETLCTPPDEWSGRAGVAWAERLANGEGFDEAAEEFVKVAEVLDKIYGR
ncbi:gfo/Idh/MocA family oxidoreductase [Pontibacter diazotrophicus]|uniref:Gfo/Idh/MocA family oxidoreductase n=1 Tax=Pontibacter diazotrophicus TaxID=1400979 RepID=A0A3D8L9T1_9BACT|nr:Gfo/Idh/MocA family oxidoreductase [Pontibacter diazotrophicus]RDV13722.1 gfo/Idh/MocA family oxidoreductase [Pontibacter diazotrophicus]